MSSRRSFSVLSLSVAMCVAGLVGFAGPAYAAATVTDNGDGSMTTAGMGSTDVLYICPTSVSASICGKAANNFSYQSVSGQNATFQGGTTVSVFGVGWGPLAPGTYNVAIVESSTFPFALVDSASNVVIGSGGGGSSSSGSSAPSSVTQQFGLPSTGTCDEAAPESLNWAGVAPGGWGISWAQWMNDGAGGPVCTRTLGYVGSGWTVL